MFARPASIAALLCVVLAGIVTSAFAQTGRIRGRVTDEDGRPVAGAHVEVAVASGRRTTWQTKTNENGDFVVITLPSGRYIVTVSKTGVGTADTRAALAIGASVTANLTLTRSAPIAHDACASRAPIRVFDEKVASAFADPPPVARLFRWLEAVEQHIPGCIDAAATDLVTWARHDVETLLADLGRLAAARQKFRELERRNPVDWQKRRAAAAGGNDDAVATMRLHERRFTLDLIDRVFRGNETLKRGAVLHADIAAFIGDDLAHRAVFVEDGRQKGRVPGTVHWEFGRRLLDLIVPSPGGDAGALLWYRAISAYLLDAGLLNEAPAHLNRARQVFPHRAEFLVDSALLHEKFASPAIQVAVQDLEANQLQAAVASRDVELERAERFLRQALALAPGDAAARVRLGHVLGELGRHAVAAAELRRAIDAGLDRERLYLAELFLGRQEQALGRRDEAKRRFQIAAALYPTAQSAGLAISHLARQGGDRKTALHTLQRVTARASADAVARDPWWFYYELHMDDAESLMDQMRKLAGAGGR